MGSYEHARSSSTQPKPSQKKVAGVNAEAQVATTEPKMEEESSAPCLLSGKGAPGPKAPAPRPTQNENSKEKDIKRGDNRFESCANPTKRYRAFITNIPLGVEWQ